MKALLSWIFMLTACGLDCPDGTVVIDGRCVFSLDAAVDAGPDADTPDVSLDVPLDITPDTFDACVPEEEVCNGVDDDCDGSTDEEVVLVFFADGDGDMFGDDEDACEACSVTECPPERAWVLVGGDCDDAEPTTAPEAAEVCDEVDNDCDEMTDEGVQNTYYADVDEDGFGDPDATMDACEAPEGFIEDATDCADGDGDAFPGQTMFFDTAITGGGGFDYNCNEDVERAARSEVDGDTPIDEAAPVQSTRCAAGCDLEPKWVGTTLPPCGGTASFWTCALGTACLIGLYPTVVTDQEVVCR